MKWFCDSLFVIQRLRLQDRVLSDVMIHLLGDDDPRVRHVAATAVSKYVYLLSQCI